MFDNYIDQLAENLDEMDDHEVREDYEEHKKRPGKDYEDYIESNVDTGDFALVENLEKHCEELWNEFDADSVTEIYEERLARLFNKLENELPVNEGVKEPRKVKI